MDSATLEHALKRLEDYEYDYPPEHVQVAVEVLSNQLPRLREGRETFEDGGAESQLRRVILRLLRRAEDQEMRSHILQAVLPNIKSFSARAQLLEVAKYGTETGERPVAETEIANSEEQLLTAIEHAPPESLSRERNLIRLLFQAREIDPERGNDLIAQLAENDSIFLSALRGLYREVHIATVGDVVSRVTYELGWDTLCTLFGEEGVRRRLQELSHLVVPEAQETGLDEKTEAALRLAERYATGWRPEW